MDDAHIFLREDQIEDEISGTRPSWSGAREKRSG